MTDIDIAAIEAGHKFEPSAADETICCHCGHEHRPRSGDHTPNHDALPNGRGCPGCVAEAVADALRAAEAREARLHQRIGDGLAWVDEALRRHSAGRPTGTSHALMEAQRALLGKSKPLLPSLALAEPEAERDE